MIARLFGPLTIVTTLMVAQQQQPPAFRSGVATVAVYATVTDRAGNPVTNLTRDDFEVLDNGRPQELTVFSRSLQPITAVLLVDTSASMALTLDLARQAAEQFIIRMRPGDQARVGSFSDKIDLGGPFTGDRDALLRWFQGLHIGNPTRLWDAIGETMNAFGETSGRRVAVLFTDGEDTASTTPGRDVLERAKAQDMMIYAVQIRSRARPGLEYQILGSATRPPSSPNRSLPSPAQVLRGLAGQTGGLHFQLTRNDDVNATFTQVATELHQQYLLGFAPRVADGRIHEIQVRTADPQLQIRARRYYQAPGEPR